MPDKIEFFTVDYRDKFAFIDKKKFTVGSFAVNFLNRYEENDNGARIAAMSSDNWILSSSMERGYLNDYEFVKAGKEILYILDVLSNFSPFGYLDIESERKTISETFTKENASFILDYYRQRAAVSLQDEGAMSLDILPDGYAELSKKANEFIGTVMRILRFYENIGNDMMKAFEHLTEFVWSLDDLEHYNESELLTLADKIFDKDKFNVTTEYTAIPKGDKKTLVKRLHFETFYSFILTDFFEGLALGHYPRQCEICETYFLMESARKQKYCMGFAPLNFTGGEKITCRKFAAKNNQKELAKNDKITDIYNRRCSCIRAEKSQGVISAEFAESAKRLAKDLKHKFRRSGYDDMILGKPFIGEPGSVCSQTFLVIGYDPQKHNFTEVQCKNIITYIQTKFFRYLVSIKKKTQNGPRGVYQFVPVQDFTHEWTDEMLYEKYNLSDDEINLIENTIRSMELSGGDD